MSPPRTVPADGGVDHTLALLSEGYRFLTDRFERFGSDIFTTRLMLRKALCVLLCRPPPWRCRRTTAA